MNIFYIFYIFFFIFFFFLSEDDDRPEDYSERMSTPVLKSCCRTVRYHLGTVMFGGFIIAVVQFVRAALAYVEENTKTWQEKNKVRFFKIQKREKKEKKKCKTN